ncbi:alpha-tocopherol transfer protein-like [Anabrus simplex]|uniref:alpha-tocopherol transfer protein-like n=1 Tax=Anabrus simplex TaxID=316456 RepID=UPI0035A2F688
MDTITESRPFAPIPTLDDLMKDNPKLRKEDIDYLQSWMSKQPHLPKIPDELLASFLHTNYYSLERAKNTIENHFTIRTHAPELFTDRDILAPEAQKQLPLVQGAKFRKKDPEGNLVWAIRLMSGDASKVDFDACFKLGLMILDQTIREDPTCSGHILIADAKGTTMAHVAVLKLTTIKRFFKYVQEGLNVRLTAVHVINVSPVVDYVLQMFKPFFNKELMDKIHVHPGPVSELYKVVPQSILPKDYGGDLDDMKEIYDYAVRSLEKHRQWFLDNEFLVDEKKRRGRSKNATEIFGIEGSFKKLEID